MEYRIFMPNAKDMVQNVNSTMVVRFATFEFFLFMLASSQSAIMFHLTTLPKHIFYKAWRNYTRQFRSLEDCIYNQMFFIRYVRARFAS